MNSVSAMSRRDKKLKVRCQPKFQPRYSLGGARKRPLTCSAKDFQAKIRRAAKIPLIQSRIHTHSPYFRRSVGTRRSKEEGRLNRARKSNGTLPVHLPSRRCPTSRPIELLERTNDDFHRHREGRTRAPRLREKWRATSVPRGQKNLRSQTKRRRRVRCRDE